MKAPLKAPLEALQGPAWWTHGPTIVRVLGFFFAALLAVSVVNISPTITLGIALGAVGGLFFLVRPTETLIGAIVFRVFLDILWWVPFTAGGLNLSQLFSGGVFAMLVAIVFLRMKGLRSHPAAGWALGMIALLALATARAIELSVDIDILVRYFTAPLMLLATGLVLTTAQLRRRLVWLISIAALVPILYSMFKLGTGMSGYVLHGYARLLGGYKNIHNHALVMMVFSLLFMSWAMSAERRWVRTGAWAVVGMTLVAVYYTYTRTGLLGWAISVLTVLAVLRQYRLLGVVLLAGSIFVLMDPDVQDRFGDLLAVFDPSVESVDRRALGSGRWGLWSWSMQEYLSHSLSDMFIGLGLGGHRLTTLDWSASFSRVGLTLDPHNDYLLYLYQMGPLGVIIYLGMLWSTFKSALYVHRHADDLWAKAFAATLAGLCAGVFLTNGVSNSFIHRSAPGWYFWCLAGIVIAEYIDVRKRVRKQEQDARRPREVAAVA